MVSHSFNRLLSILSEIWFKDLRFWNVSISLKLASWMLRDERNANYLFRSSGFFYIKRKIITKMRFINTWCIEENACGMTFAQFKSHSNGNLLAFEIWATIMRRSKLPIINFNTLTHNSSYALRSIPLFQPCLWFYLFMHKFIFQFKR